MFLETNVLKEIMRQIINEEIDNISFNFALLEIDTITQAKDIARDVHRGQWRKNEPLPYIVHPLRIYQRVISFGLSEKYQVLAILHDTVEDSKNPQRILDKIKELFGGGTADLVVALSHDKSVDYKEYLLNLAKRYPTAFIVKLLDIIDNVSSKPHLQQKNKYKEAIEYIVSKGISIDPKIKDSLFNLIGVEK